MEWARKIKRDFIQSFLLVLCKKCGLYSHWVKGNFCFFQLSLCLCPLCSHCPCIPFSSLCLLSSLLSFSLCVSIVSTTLPFHSRVSNRHSGYSYPNQQYHAKKRRHKQVSVADGPAFFTAVRLCLTNSATHIPVSSFWGKELRSTQDRVLREVWYTHFRWSVNKLSCRAQSHISLLEDEKTVKHWLLLRNKQLDRNINFHTALEHKAVLTVTTGWIHTTPPQTSWTH